MRTIVETIASTRANREIPTRRKNRMRIDVPCQSSRVAVRLPIFSTPKSVSPRLTTISVAASSTANVGARQAQVFTG